MQPRYIPSLMGVDLILSRYEEIRNAT